jgi:hypothetical protein
MPIGYKVAHGGKLIVEVWTKQISKREMLAHNEKSLNDPAILPGRSEFVDLTRAEGPRIGEMELRELIEGYRSHTAKMVDINIAIVATGEQFDQARIFERLTTPHLITVVVFNGVDTACTWLGLDEAEIREHVRDVLRDMAAT